jgi:hypothetical protein
MNSVTSGISSAASTVSNAASGAVSGATGLVSGILPGGGNDPVAGGAQSGAGQGSSTVTVTGSSTVTIPGSSTVTVQSSSAVSITGTTSTITASSPALSNPRTPPDDTSSIQFHLSSPLPQNTNGQVFWAGNTAVDSSNNRFFVTDQQKHRIEVFSTVGAGAYLFGFGSQGSGAGQFYNPMGIAVISPTVVMIADYSSTRIQRCTVSGSGSAATVSCVVFDVGAHPMGLAVVGNDLYFTGQYQHQFSKCSFSNIVTATTAACTTFGSEGSAVGQFKNPSKIAVTGSDVYLIEQSINNRIQKCTLSGTSASCIAFGSMGSAPGQFSSPFGIAVNTNGSLVYVADTGNNRIQRCIPAGSNFNCTAFGSPGAGVAQFSNISRLTNDSAGTVYVGDQGNYRIQKCIFSGQPVAMSCTAYGSEGTSAGQFGAINSLAKSDVANVLYVMDFLGGSGSHRIQKCNLNAGSMNCQQILLPNSGSLAISNPKGIAVDTIDKLYISDANYSVLKKCSVDWAAGTLTSCEESNKGSSLLQPGPFALHPTTGKVVIFDYATFQLK